MTAREALARNYKAQALKGLELIKSLSTKVILEKRDQYVARAGYARRQVERALEIVTRLHSIPHQVSPVAGGA